MDDGGRQNNQRGAASISVWNVTLLHRSPMRAGRGAMLPDKKMCRCFRARSIVDRSAVGVDHVNEPATDGRIRIIILYKRRGTGVHSAVNGLVTAGCLPKARKRELINRIRHRSVVCWRKS